MIHYHGLPITPVSAALKAIAGGHAFVSGKYPDQLGCAAEVCQSFALDNGAFSYWKAKVPIKDWGPFYALAEQCRRIPSCDFAVIPDIIEGATEADQDALIAEWPLPKWFGAPVWHLHESLDRLERLANTFPRVCLGSSKEYSVIKTPAWWERMGHAMRVVCNDDGEPLCKLHGLRMLDPDVFTRFPFASADSTNIARNIGIDQTWRGNYMPPNKETRALVMRERIESLNSPVRWNSTALEFAPVDQGILL